MKPLYEKFLILSPALIAISATALVNDLSVSSATVAAGTAAVLFKAAKEVFY